MTYSDEARMMRIHAVFIKWNTTEERGVRTNLKPQEDYIAKFAQRCFCADMSTTLTMDLYSPMVWPEK